MIYRVVWTLGAAATLVGAAYAQDAAFEEMPVLSAGAILRPEIARGALHQVRDTVVTGQGVNQYVIDSEFGPFTAQGNTLLLERVREIYAIAKLKEVSRGEEYAQAVKRAAKTPIDLARNLVNDPVDTVASVPQGLWKFVNRAGQGVKEATRRREASAYEDNRASNLLGVSKLKREWANELNVDPYSTNEALQRELDSVAWTSFAGKATVSALTMGLTGGVAIAATSVSFADAASGAVRDMAPLDLRLANEGRLKRMGVSEALTGRFLDHPAFSPMAQTRLVFALEQMKGVKGRADFVKLAVEDSKGEQDALFFSKTAQLLAQLYLDGVEISRIGELDGLPVGLGPRGEVTVALEWDYAAWTEGVVNFAEHLRKFATANKPNANTRDLPRLLIALSGDASPRFQQEVRDRGAALRLRLDAPVLK